MPEAQTRLPAFKAYDVRGRIPDELNEDLVGKVARAFAAFLQPRRVAVGYDVRLTSPRFAALAAEALQDSGVDVVDIGRCGTEMLYFAEFHLGLDGGIVGIQYCPVRVRLVFENPRLRGGVFVDVRMTVQVIR